MIFIETDNADTPQIGFFHPGLHKVYRMKDRMPTEASVLSFGRNVMDTVQR